MTQSERTIAALSADDTQLQASSTELSREEITNALLSARASITAYLVLVTRNFHLAEDIYQDVCLQVLGSSATFDSFKHLMNWVRMVGRNRAIDQIRIREGRYQGLSDELLEQLSTDWPAHSSRVIDVEDMLQECLASLTANSRRLLHMRYVEERSAADIAATLGVKVESIYQALSRIHKTLGECIERKLNGLEYVT